MGYMTNYKLTITPEPSKEVLDAMNMHNTEYDELTSYGGFQKGFLRSVYEGNADDCKWYDHEEDMEKFSKKFPEYVFALEGRGEEPGDLWFHYFKNGKSQHCPAKISFDEYDEAKLQ